MYDNKEDLKSPATTGQDTTQQPAGTAPESPALHAGWELASDPTSGRPYYFHRASGQSSWEPPSADAVSAAPQYPPPPAYHEAFPQPPGNPISAVVDPALTTGPSPSTYDQNTVRRPPSAAGEPQGEVQGDTIRFLSPFDTMSSEPQDDGYSGGEVCGLVTAWVFSVLCWVALILLILSAFDIGMPTSGAAGLFTGVYLLHLILAFCTPTAKYLTSLRFDLADYIDNIRTAGVESHWSVRCYHEETERYTDSKGNRRTRTVQVTTHRASRSFHFDRWVDDTSPLIIDPKVPVLRFRLGWEATPGDKFTRNCEEEEFAAWIALPENNVDTYQSSSKGYTSKRSVDGAFLACRDADSVSCFLHIGWLIFFTLLTLGVFYRHWFYSVTTSKDHTIRKKVFRTPPQL